MLAYKEKQIISESTHWYNADGSACELVKGKNGADRAPNLKDARLLHLYPSVTGINKVMANPTLNSWLVRNAIQAAINMVDVGVKDIDAIQSEAAKKSEKSALRGAEMHKWIERFILKEDISPADDPSKYACENIVSSLKEIGVELEELDVEVSFCITELGYGGRIDAKKKDNSIFIDWKTSEKPRDFVYESEQRQGSAYIRAFDLGFNTRFFDVIIHQSTGTVKVVETTPKELERAYKVFTYLKEIWFLDREYDPRKS